MARRRRVRSSGAAHCTGLKPMLHLYFMRITAAHSEPLVGFFLCRALKAQEATKKAKQMAQVGGPDSQVSRAPTTTQTREDDPKVRCKLAVKRGSRIYA